MTTSPASGPGDPSHIWWSAAWSTFAAAGLNLTGAWVILHTLLPFDPIKSEARGS